MSIRIGNSCNNCSSLTANQECQVHSVKVSPEYTCDTFDLKTNLKDDSNCSNCARFEQSSCAHPKKATAGMLCSQWAPRAVV